MHVLLEEPFLRKTPIITAPKKRTVQPEDVFEDTAFKLGFEIVKFLTRLQSLSSSLFLKIDTTHGSLTSSSIR